MLVWLWIYDTYDTHEAHLDLSSFASSDFAAFLAWGSLILFIPLSGHLLIFLDCACMHGRSTGYLQDMRGLPLHLSIHHIAFIFLQSSSKASFFEQAVVGGKMHWLDLPRS